MASRKNLSLVGADHHNNTPESPDFANFLNRWQLMETRLQDLCAKHDAIIHDTSASNPLVEDLRAIQMDLEQEQTDLLHDLLASPAKNRHDMIAKLQIWKSIVMPDGSNPDLAQLSDHIVNSVLSDLVSGRAD